MDLTSENLAVMESTTWHERNQTSVNARMHSRECSHMDAHKYHRVNDIETELGPLLVYSESTPLNDVPIEKRLDVRYWMD